MPSAYLYTLGCRLNQTESAIMAGQIKNLGYEIRVEPDGVDLCVINTCTVTGQSDQKCRQAVRSLKRRNPKAIIAVVGCFSQVSTDQVRAMDGVDLVLGNREKMNITEHLSAFTATGQPVVASQPILRQSFEITDFEREFSHTRANLKIQDGCDFACSFCLIPQARGRSSSRKWANLKQEATYLADQGIKELILTGVNIGTFEQEGKGFMELLTMLEQIKGIQRLRISSIEPTTIGPEIFEMMADPQSKLLPYLHLPLQSADDATLKAMKRRYEFDDYRRFVEQGLEKVPQLCLGSDVMSGFPGEDDESFSAGFERLKKLPVHYFHVFVYAPRPKTASLKMPQQVPQQVAQRRAQVLRELSAQKRHAFIQGFVGQELEVLFEEDSKQGFASGYTGNYIKVQVPTKTSLTNQIRKVRLTQAQEERALGVLS